jgi:UDP-N-acetylglucosamine diphosphorylase/glucosamine-1-phosphate N-acetyltransferase
MSDSRSQKSGNCRLFLSARAILDKRIESSGREAVLLSGEEVIGFRLGKGRASTLTLPSPFRGEGKKGRGLFEADMVEEQVKAKVVRWPWDLVEFSAGELERELEVKGQRSKVKSQNAEGRRLPKGVTLVGLRNRLTIARGARIWPGVVISTETGAVMIDRGAQVRPGSFIEGPCYVGPGTVIDGARIRPGCSFGPECRIGGEVEASVFQGFSNKHHDGFIGHSFVGEWANLGALTTNSDLKNAYQPVQVFYDGKPVDTGLVKVGCFIGDHVKTAIGTLFNTGARVGTFANWFEPGLSPKEIRTFSWGRATRTNSEVRTQNSEVRSRKAGNGGRDSGRWKLEDAVVCARQVMERRGVTMTPAYERRLRTLYAPGALGHNPNMHCVGRSTENRIRLCPAARVPRRRKA